MRIDSPDPSQTGQLRRLWKIAFGDDEKFLDSFFSHAYAPDRARCVTENGQVLAMLYWFDCACDGQKLAYLYAVATDPRFQEQGLCRSLMADTRAHLAARGYDGILLVPGEESLRRLYRKLGYADCGGIREDFVTAGGSPIPLRPLSGEEYVRMRKKYLPPHSVEQEGENAQFLFQAGQLYALNAGLVAINAGSEPFFAWEFLGDPADMPRILQTLHRENGTFRSFGAEKSFAMFCPLSENSAPPDYFVLAFD